MIVPVIGRDIAVALWVSQHAPFDPARGFGNCTAIGFQDGERLIAGLVYHNYDPEHGTIEISGAAESPRWLTRASLDLMFRYPFDGIGCQMVFMRTAVADADRGINRITKAFGFTQIRVPRFYGREADGMLHILTDDQWRASRLVFGPKAG